MLEKYIGKKVRMLVSSKSGAGVSCSTHVGVVENSMVSMIIVFGVISGVDQRFVELKDTRIVCNDLLKTSRDKLDVMNVESSISLINIDNIIAVSLV